MTSSPISLRLPDDTLRQLDTLAEAWQTNRSAAMARLIETGYTAEMDQARVAAFILDDPAARKVIENAVDRLLHPSKYDKENGQ